MFKQLFLSCALSLVSFSTIAMMSSNDYIVENLTSQLNHVNAQINATKRAWKESLLHIAMATKASPELYAKTKPVLEKIIVSESFSTRMNNTVDQQIESIVNNNASFKDVRNENSLSDVSSKTMTSFAQKLYTAMANKAYYYLLGKKLAAKSKDLAATIRATQQTFANQTQELQY